MTTTALQWTKCPSVRREGKHFFTTPGFGTRYWVVQTQGATTWHVSDDCGAAWGSFATAQLAMRAVEAHATLTPTP